MFCRSCGTVFAKNLTQVVSNAATNPVPKAEVILSHVRILSITISSSLSSSPSLAGAVVGDDALSNTELLESSFYFIIDINSRIKITEMRQYINIFTIYVRIEVFRFKFLVLMSSFSLSFDSDIIARYVRTLDGENSFSTAVQSSSSIFAQRESVPW